MKKILLSIGGLFFAALLMGQELNVNLTINTPKLQTADPAVFKNLESALNDFFGSTKWTEDYYEPEERINVTIAMTITEELSQRDFNAELTIQASRPVFGSDYESVIFSTVDKAVQLSYEQFQPIQYTSNSFNDNLTSVLSFYSYIILGLDADSFSPLGGQEHFQTAQAIMNLVPQDVAGRVKGWRSVDGNRNRYWLVENLLTPRVQPMRQALYDYHRLGLDKMHEDDALGRVLVIDALEKIAEVDRNYPNSMIIQVFSTSKSQEILSIFAQGTPEQKTKATDIMTRLDPSNARTFRAIRG